MVYSVGDFRNVINEYLFENDEFGNIHVYKIGSMEYLDMIDIDYKYDFDEFISICNKWINKK